MGGAISAIANVGISSIVGDFAGPLSLGSVVTDFGTEFASSITDFTGFELPLNSVADFGGFAEIGSFAGNADWFNTFNPGSIIDTLPGVGDFSLGSVTSSLPSLNNIVSIANPVSDFSGFITTGQSLLPTNLVSAAQDVVNTGDLNILDAAQTAQLTRNIDPNLVSFLNDPALPTAATATASVNRIINAAENLESTQMANEFISAYDPETSSWSVYDTINGTTVQTGLTEQQALLAEQDLGITDGITLNTSTTTSDDPFEASRLEALANLNANQPTEADVISATNGITVAQTDAARYQQSIRSLRNNKAQSSDWRVRLRLAPNSQYLYNATQPGILAALKLTDGVIFPYTPTVETAYKANYDTYDLTHSNYRGYFYKNSYVDAVNLRATFTAQDSKEADYLLAVIHFFRSCTKMFYGQDSQRGAPPPLVYLSGYGDYQFSEHPCLISQFNYSLPPDVDYIRAQNNLQSNTNQLNNRLRNPIANNPVAYTANRILNSGLFSGALATNPAMANNLANSAPTYVPTKMEISITMLPVQSRSQVSNNFSVQGFANGNLLRDGYW
jgi:hypothetical protein